MSDVSDPKAPAPTSAPVAQAKPVVAPVAVAKPAPPAPKGPLEVLGSHPLEHRVPDQFDVVKDGKILGRSKDPAVRARILKDIGSGRVASPGGNQ